MANYSENNQCVAAALEIIAKDKAERIFEQQS